MAENGKIDIKPSLQTTSPLANNTNRTLFNGTSPATTSTTPLMTAHKLSSLVPPRDLTLGGRGGAKKIFTPNLNVTRNKDVNVKTAKDTTATGRGRGRGRGRGGEIKSERGSSATRGGVGRGKSTLIQTTGVFSEGAGAALNVRRPASSGGSSIGRSTDDGAAAYITRPVINKKETKYTNEHEEKTDLRDIVGDSDDDDDFTEQRSEMQNIPIRLVNTKRQPIKTEIKVENLDVSNDPETRSDTAVDIARQKNTAQVLKIQSREQRAYGSEPLYASSMTELLNTTEPTLMVMQLPDVLPCRNEEDFSATSNTQEEEAPNRPTLKPEPTQPSDSMKKLQDGQIGKLIRYKSGKVKLVLGQTWFDLSMGIAPGFLQEIMSITSNPEERSSDMFDLGPLKAKLTATPDWDYIVKNNC